MAVENVIIFNQTNPVTKTVFVDIITIHFDLPCVYFWKFKLKHISKQKYVAWLSKQSS